jgi:hypothetical protein
LRISCCAAYFLLCCGFSAALRRHALRAGSHSPGQKRRGETGSSAIREAGEIGTYRRVSASTPCAFILLTGTPASANVAVTQVSHDICTDVQAQHNTGAEPDTFVFGSTNCPGLPGRPVLRRWRVQHWLGHLHQRRRHLGARLPPGITTNGGTFLQASDASVAFDARHNVWMISSLAINGSTWTWSSAVPPTAA